MTLHTSIDGAISEITSVPVGIDGAVVELDSMLAGVDGANVEIFSAGKKVHNPVNSVTVTGTYSQYASNYGAAVTEDGKVVIYTKFTYNTNYEDVYFVDNGMAGDLVYRTYYAGTTDSTGYCYFAVFEGVTEDIDVTLDFLSRNGTDDYVKCNIESTAASSGRDYKIPDVQLAVAENIFSYSVYDVAYCENGNIILLAKTTKGSVHSTEVFPSSLIGLTMAEKSYSRRNSYNVTNKTGIFCIIISEFQGGLITILPESYVGNVKMTITASL